MEELLTPNLNGFYLPYQYHIRPPPIPLSENGIYKTKIGQTWKYGIRAQWIISSIRANTRNIKGGRREYL